MTAISFDENSLEELLLFLRKFSHLAEPHAFTLARQVGVAHLLKCWPTEWLDFLDTLKDQKGFQQTCSNILLDSKSVPPRTWPVSLCDFIFDCRRLSLPRNEPIVLPDFPERKAEKKKTKMSLKKEHEVDNLSRFIIQFARKIGIDVIVDVGSGSGYLSHRLAEEFPILAIDGDATRIHYSSRIARIPLSNGSRCPIEHVTLDLNTEKLISLLESYLFNEEEGRLSQSTGKRPRYLVTALHACGDLSASTILDCYKRLDTIKCIAVISCCYQMLSPKGFPLSQRVKKQSVHNISRFPYGAPKTSTLNLPLFQPSYRILNCACQTVVNFTPQRLRDTWRSFTYRALLEAFLESKGYSMYTSEDDCSQSKIKIGMSGKSESTQDFVIYTQRCLQKLGIVIEEEDIRQFQYQQDSERLLTRIAFTTMIKRLLGPCIERLLLLDRLAYLKEGGDPEEAFRDSRLISIFEFAKSARNMMLVSVRSTTPNQIEPSEVFKSRTNDFK